MATEAYERGFAVGFREDGSFQADDLRNVELPVVMLDNDFRNPDLDRYLEQVDRYRPDVAILGDAYSYDEGTELVDAADAIEQKYSDVEPVIVPKCWEALDATDSDRVVGYANGYSDVKPDDFSDPVDWRGRRVWILGGNPHEQYAVIDVLTQPTLDDRPPADIVGVDGNGFYKAAFYGDFWTPSGYTAADHLSIRETVARSLDEIKRFWRDRGIWPDTEPIDRYGPAVIISRENKTISVTERRGCGGEKQAEHL